MDSLDANRSKQRQSVLDVGQRNRLESVQSEVRRNNELLTTLRRENKELKAAYQQTLRGQQGVDMDEHYQKEEDLLHNKMCVVKRSLNAVKSKNAELVAEIEKTQESTRVVQQEGNGTMDENSSVAQKIRALENRLDKCLVKHNEVNAIRRTYETLLERLRLEQAGFDSQLSATGKALQSTEKELADLTDVSSEARKKRDETKGRLAHLRTQLVEERRQQRKDMEERRGFIQEKRDHLEARQRELLQKMTTQEERHQRQLTNATSTSAKKKASRSVTSSTMLRPEEVERLQAQRDLYQRLRDATVATSVSEIISKLRERRENHRQLEDNATQLDETVSKLSDQKHSLQQTWEELNQKVGGALVRPQVTRAARDEFKTKQQGKAAADNDDDGDDDVEDVGGEPADYRLLGDRRREQRQVLDEFDGHLATRRDELEDMQHRQEALAQLLLDVEAGVRNLAEKLAVQHGNAGPAPALMGGTSANNASNAASSVATAMVDGVNTTGATSNDVSGLSVNDRRTVEALKDTSAATVDLLRSCDAKLQIMMDEVTPEEIDDAERAMRESKVIIPEANIRLPELLGKAGAGGLADEVGAASPNQVDGEDRRPHAAGKPFGSAAATNAMARRAVDDFPENEIRDRLEMKMMSTATVERETKKARKQQLQQRKEETV